MLQSISQFEINCFVQPFCATVWIQAILYTENKKMRILKVGANKIAKNSKKKTERYTAEKCTENKSDVTA